MFYAWVSNSKLRFFLWIFHTPSSATPIHIQCRRYLNVSSLFFSGNWLVQSSKPLGSMQMGITIRAFLGFCIITVNYHPLFKGWYLILQAFPALLPCNVLMPTHHRHIIKYLMAEEAVIQVACENVVGSCAIRADKTFIVSLWELAVCGWGFKQTRQVGLLTLEWVLLYYLGYRYSWT